MDEKDPEHPTYRDRLQRAQERAAIHEYDAGMPREEAEARAASAWRVRMVDLQADLAKKSNLAT